MKKFSYLTTAFRTHAVSLMVAMMILALFTLVACSQSEDPAPNDDMDGKMEMDDDNGSGDGPSPNFSLNALGGGTVSLKDYKDKVVVLFFFGFSCPNCISAGPAVQQQIADVYQSNTEFAIIGLDQWDGNEAGVQSFKNNTSITFPLLLKGSGTASAYSTTYDRLIVVDQSGNIAYKSNTSASSSISDVVDKVESLL